MASSGEDFEPGIGGAAAIPSKEAGGQIGSFSPAMTSTGQLTGAVIPALADFKLSRSLSRDGNDRPMDERSDQNHNR